MSQKPELRDRKIIFKSRNGNDREIRKSELKIRWKAQLRKSILAKFSFCENLYTRSFVTKWLPSFEIMQDASEGESDFEPKLEPGESDHTASAADGARGLLIMNTYSSAMY